MNRKRLVTLVLTVAVLGTSFSACGKKTEEMGTLPAGTEVVSSKESEAEEKYKSGEWKKYEEPITVTFGNAYDVNNNFFSAMANIGEPYDDNRWTRYFEDEVGVKTEYSLLAPNADDYKQKLTLAMTSGDLPDIFFVPDMATYQQLADAGVIADLTEIYQTDANPTLKKIMEEEGENFLANYKIGGKLYCLPGKMPSTNGYSYLWLRKDWLDKLDLEIPKTLDDVAKIAEAFATLDPDENGKDDTIGLNIDSLYTYFGADSIFWAFGAGNAGQKYWQKLDDGTVGYSMVQPENKEALKWLNNLYENGWLNQDFSTMQISDYSQLIASGKVGMFYGCHWYANFMDAVRDDIKDQDWIAVLAPGTDGNPASVYASVDTNGLYCVNTNCEHPEAIMALFNAYAEKLFGENNDFDNFFAIEENSNLWQCGPFSFLAADVDIKPHREMKQALADGTTDQLTGTAKSYWEQIQNGSLNYKLEFGPENSCFNLVDETYPDIIVWNQYQGVPTVTQSTNWGGMQEIIDTAYISMINGETDIDTGFDQMVDAWMAAGGEAVTAEVNGIISGR